MSHKPGGRLPLLSSRPALTLATLKRAATNFAAWRGMNSLHKTVTLQLWYLPWHVGPSEYILSTFDDFALHVDTLGVVQLCAH